MFERFTDRSRRVVVLASEEARLLDHNYIGTEHLLLALARIGEGIAADVLVGLGVSVDRVRASVQERIGRGSSAPVGHIPFTPRAKKVLELSLREALQLGHNYIGTEHLLLGLVSEGEGVAALTLTGLGIELSAVRDAVLERLGDISPGAEEVPRGTRQDPPNCPGCYRSLLGSTASKVIVAAGEEGPEGDERRVRVVYCSNCGRTLGVLPE